MRRRREGESDVVNKANEANLVNGRIEGGEWFLYDGNGEWRTEEIW